MKCDLILISKYGKESEGVEYPSVRKAKKSAEDAVKNGYLYRFRIVKHPKIKS